MNKLVLAGLGAIGVLGLTAGSAAAWDDSYRYCPGARWCPSAYYSLNLHRGYDYRYLPEYRQTYFRHHHSVRRSGCTTRRGRERCR